MSRLPLNLSDIIPTTPKRFTCKPGPITGSQVVALALLQLVKPDIEILRTDKVVPADMTETNVVFDVLLRPNERPLYTFFETYWRLLDPKFLCGKSSAERFVNTYISPVSRYDADNRAAAVKNTKGIINSWVEMYNPMETEVAGKTPDEIEAVEYNNLIKAANDLTPVLKKGLEVCKRRGLADDSLGKSLDEMGYDKIVRLEQYFSMKEIMHQLMCYKVRWVLYPGSTPIIKRVSPNCAPHAYPDVVKLINSHEAIISAEHKMTEFICKSEAGAIDFAHQYDALPTPQYMVR